MLCLDRDSKHVTERQLALDGSVEGTLMAVRSVAVALSKAAPLSWPNKVTRAKDIHRTTTSDARDPNQGESLGQGQFGKEAF